VTWAAVVASSARALDVFELRRDAVHFRRARLRTSLLADLVRLLSGLAGCER
jgi:hypothetical protein